MDLEIRSFHVSPDLLNLTCFLLPLDLLFDALQLFSVLQCDLCGQVDMMFRILAASIQCYFVKNSARSYLCDPFQGRASTARVI